MANSSVEKFKEFWNSQINDDEKWGLNSVSEMIPNLMRDSLKLLLQKLLPSIGLFMGSIFFMRNFGELMSI